MKFYLRLSSAGVIKVIAVDVGPLENSSTGTNLSQCIIQELQFNDCKSVLVMQLLYLGFDVLLQSGNNIERSENTPYMSNTCAIYTLIYQNHSKPSWWKSEKPWKTVLLFCNCQLHATVVVHEPLEVEHVFLERMLCFGPSSLFISMLALLWLLVVDVALIIPWFVVYYPLSLTWAASNPGSKGFVMWPWMLANHTMSNVFVLTPSQRIQMVNHSQDILGHFINPSFLVYKVLLVSCCRILSDARDSLPLVTAQTLYRERKKLLCISALQSNQVA